MTPELHGGLCLACTVASAFITWLRLDTTYAHHDTTTLNVGGRLPLRSVWYLHFVSLIGGCGSSPVGVMLVVLPMLVR